VSGKTHTHTQRTDRGGRAEVALVVAKSDGAETGRTMLGLSKTGASTRWWRQLLGEGGGVHCRWRFPEMGVDAFGVLDVYQR
jgi:hypothetical protein